MQNFYRMSKAKYIMDDVFVDELTYGKVYDVIDHIINNFTNYIVIENDLGEKKAYMLVGYSSGNPLFEDVTVSEMRNLTINEILE